MRFPLSLTLKMAAYIAGQKIGGNKRFPLVLMLEPLHKCNLHCSGCGRIREYKDTIGQELSVEDCLDAVKECNAPIVSICGGEPLIYGGIIELVDKILKLGKLIYLCTNGQILTEKINEFAELARNNPAMKNRFYWNIHLDGTEPVHDVIVERQGAFAKAFEGIKAAKQAGFYVYTNSTLYKQSSVADLIELAERLTAIKIDGMMLAPGYGYDSVENPETIFLTRQETHRIFQEIREKMRHFRITATPVYLDFLCGSRELPCAAWANPTWNIRGWKAPCYLLTDTHYKTYKEFIEQTDWTKIGFGEDKRCTDCLMHCGYEPAAVLFGNTMRDLLRTAVWQLQ